MAFEVFNRQTASRTTEPTITLQRRGTISMSQPAVRMLGVSGEENHYPIELVYDPEERIVGFRLARDNPNPHLLRRQGKSGVFLVSAKLFVAHYKIDVSQARRYQARDFGEGIVGLGLQDSCAFVGRSAKETVKEESGEKRSKEAAMQPSMFGGEDDP